VDRFAANTLRTLGIVLISIFVIGASLILLLLALCLGAFGTSGGQFHSSSDEQAFLACVIAIAVLLVGGVFSIAKLAKGIVRGAPEYAAPLSIFPTPATATAGPAPAAAPPPVQAEAPPRTIDAAHFSSASRAAIQQLVLAISAKVAVEVLLTLFGWISVARPHISPLQTFRFSFLAWGLAAVAPLLVLLYALLRHPGPRAFAYSLVIPALHIFFGLFGHSVSLVYVLRSLHPSLAVFSLLPWLLDFLILYLAWKAIRLTGIQPSPTRLIVATAVIFFYTSILPIVVVIMNQFWHLAR
jgi:hypothetical protein